MESKLQKGVIVKIQRFSIQDGPGIRTTVFLKGCFLRCLWCSNPETQEPGIEVEYSKEKCIPQCYECVGQCDAKAISKDGEYIAIDRKKCSGCGRCVEVCYRKALTVVGEEMDVAEVLNEIEKDRPFYEKSGGGVTLSGGEPLYQHRFAVELLRQCKERGISTALDTTGYVDWDILKNTLEYTDIVLYDIKHLDPEEHKKLTGVSNDVILENARRISEKFFPILIFRIPVIPGINDNPKNLKELAQFVRSLSNLPAIHLLPYHRLGVFKYTRLGREYTLKNLQPPTRDYIRRVAELLETFGIRPLIVT
jgi:pyruvate formate lyase activating enzyme